MFQNRVSNRLSKYKNSKNSKVILLIMFGIAAIIIVCILTKKDVQVKPQDNNNYRTQNQVVSQEKQDASKAQEIVVPGAKSSQDDAMRKQFQDKLTQLADTQDQVVGQVNKMASDQTQNNNAYQDKINQLNQKLDALASAVTTKQDMERKTNSSGGIKTKPEDLQQIQEIDMDAKDDNSTTINVDNPNHNQQQQATQNVQVQNNNKNTEHKSVGEYIPANTVMRGNLIEGISANTGGNASSEPTPVLIKLTDLASLPNHFRVNIKDCRVSGSGYGDLSTERVKIRLDRLSCILRNGNVIDVPIKGNVSGEDGKAGIRGIVVNHNGSKIAMAAIAGTASGLANAAQQSTQTQMVSPIGVTNTVNPNQAFGSAVAGGAGQGFQTVSTYYANMLNQITPAIEVSSGRNVDVILQQGIELKEVLPTSTAMVSDSISLPFNQLNR